METKDTITISTETYKGLTIKTVEYIHVSDPFRCRQIVPELKTPWGASWCDYGKDLAKRAITRALHGTLQNYTITYKNHSLYYEPKADTYYIYSPKGTLFGNKPTFEAAKEAIDRQLKITEKNQNNQKN